jgi:hypothetical protein
LEVPQPIILLDVYSTQAGMRLEWRMSEFKRTLLILGAIVALAAFSIFVAVTLSSVLHAP